MTPEKKEYLKKWREQHKIELAEYQKKYRAKNREVLLKSQRESYAKNREARIATSKAYAERNSAVVKEKQKKRWDEKPYSLKRAANLRKYGLTIEQYEQMLAQQNGRCATCKEIPERMCVDHCHRTGAVRGLLCSGCNTALGFLKEDLLRIYALADYIKER